MLNYLLVQYEIDVKSFLDAVTERVMYDSEIHKENDMVSIKIKGTGK